MVFCVLLLCMCIPRCWKVIDDSFLMFCCFMNHKCGGFSLNGVDVLYLYVGVVVYFCC